MMGTNDCMKKSMLVFVLCLFALASTMSAANNLETESGSKDRQAWCELCYRIAKPILQPMSQGKLQQQFNLELSPTWDGRNPKVAYMEAFGRLMAGISPWLSLPDDNTQESKMRKQLRDWSIQAYKNAVDPGSPDYLLWEGEDQILVDAAYLVESFMRAPEVTWNKLDSVTQQRYIDRLIGLRVIRPAYNNWLLFRAMTEAFLLSVGEPADLYALTVATRKIEEWYLSDGWYSDGPEMALDYYNSYVMHPMYIEVLEICKRHNVYVPVSVDLAVRRMQRFNTFMERLISPEGTYPAFGRSVIYRMGAFQTMALAAWRFGLPQGLSNGQVRSALSAVMKNMFSVEDNFDKDNYLRLGFAGHQPHIANYYSNNGSLYMTSLVYLPLGLAPDAPFWTDEAQPWTSQKAWSGKEFPIDEHISLKR